eukprot:CAMPEP_0114981634 /NCGR_PEP_ID=MMETSP0216-20121206/5648_1 /TAXON_ID=223996 /ORGANISM="Protocruzia adherens, Strain Boccale" /LENGTH=356 /DNA_ID=CAMNT_0002343317 /DNA_START=29 /DNA_END=1099 /DNA_ORIENTATION=+
MASREDPDNNPATRFLTEVSQDDSSTRGTDDPLESSNLQPVFTITTDGSALREDDHYSTETSRNLAQRFATWSQNDPEEDEEMSAGQRWASYTRRPMLEEEEDDEEGEEDEEEDYEDEDSEDLEEDESILINNQDVLAEQLSIFIDDSYCSLSVEGIIDAIVIDVGDSEIASELLDHYGAFGLIIYSRFKQAKLLEEFPQSIHFLQNVLEFYLNNIAHNDRESCDNLRNLFAVLPPLKQIQCFSRTWHEDEKDLIIVKLILDIYEGFLKKFDAPLYQKYTREFIPLAVEFYSQLSATMLASVLRELKNVIIRLGRPNWKPYLLMYKTPEDYLQYYENQKLMIANLTAGTPLELYYI